MGGVGLGRGSHQHHGIRQRQTGLRQTDGVGNVNSGLDDGDDLRPGQADILARADHQTAAGAGQVTRFQQTAQIVQRRVWVGAAHRLLVGRDDVIVVVAELIIPHGRAHGDLLHHVQCDRAAAVFYGCSGDGKFQIAQRLAHIAARTLGQVFQRVVGNEHGRLVLGPEARSGAAQPGADVVGGQGFELKYRAAGQKRVIYIKVGILGGGGNQGDGTLLHTFQKALLLALVKILYLVKI